MKLTQFNLEDFNPDGMTMDEIQQWIAFIGQGQRPQVTKQWFAGVKGQYRIVRMMRNYLYNKLAAMELRTNGSIAEAMKYEAICDRIYRMDLPASVRW